jgi:hypothetical protein
MPGPPETAGSLAVTAGTFAIMPISTIPNPLRWIGWARVAAGGWFIANGVTTLTQFKDLQSQAQRLLGPDAGTTDAPIRSLLTLGLAAALVVLGLALIVLGIRATRRLALPADGPVPLDRSEVIATLTRHQAPAFGDGPAPIYPPLRRWLADQLADMPWWNRDIIGTGVRAFVRSCSFVLILSALCLALRFVATDNPLGPFPLTYVLLVLVATAAWAALSLMLIPSHGPRIESVAFPLTRRAGVDGGVIIESPPALLPAEPGSLGTTLGIAGVAVQCLLPAWWNLSLIGYPLLATSIVRHAGSIAGGIVFFLLGQRMIASAAVMLLRVRYESTLVFLDITDHDTTGYAAAVRTESRGIAGPRHVTSAVASSHVREEAGRLITR